jgi:uncharacterized UPF0160 family protein
MKTIVTHPGKFHQDETLAIALLQVFLPKVNDYTIIRTREQKLIDEADILIDVGGKHNESLMEFDHHHFNKDDKLYGKSSAGLIWDWLCKTYKLNYPTIDKLVKDADDQDTGIKMQEQFHIANIIGSFNADNIDGDEQYSQFKKAIEFTKQIIQNMKRKYILHLVQVSRIEDMDIETVNGIEIIKLKKGEDYIRAELLIGLADFYLSFDNVQKAWQVQTIALKKGEYGSKYSLAELHEPHEIFVHKSGFIGKYKYEPDDKHLRFGKANGNTTTVIEVSLPI